MLKSSPDDGAGVVEVVLGADDEAQAEPEHRQQVDLETARRYRLGPSSSKRARVGSAQRVTKFPQLRYPLTDSFRVTAVCYALTERDTRNMKK